jgi:hypothetical protein
MDTDNALDGLATTGLALLPFEMLALIISDVELTANEFSALRLTCRALNRAATPRLYRRIHVSKLIADRDSFLAICASPHLAVHVREVAWLEIGWNMYQFDMQLSQVLAYHWHALDGTDEFLSADFRDQASASFWLMDLPTPAEVARRHLRMPDSISITRERTIAEFRNVFLAAIDSLPGLQTFTSEPMPSARVINPGGAFEMTASIFQTFQDQPEIGGDVPQTNDGLFLFLAEAMRRPTSTVTRLRWADEFLGMSHVRGLNPLAFERLESIELCLTPGRHVRPSDFLHLAAAIARAAPTLRHLKLCLEHASPHTSSGALEQALLLSPFGGGGAQCSLLSLSLVALHLSTDELLAVIMPHAGTLRHLHLESMAVEPRLIGLLRNAGPPKLNLKTMRVVNDREDDDDFHLLCERAVLRYIHPGQDKQLACQHPPSIPYGNRCDGSVRILAENESFWSGPLANDSHSNDGWSDSQSQAGDADEAMWHATFATEPNWGDCESDFGPADDIISDVSEEFVKSIDYRQQPGWPRWTCEHFPAEDGQSLYMYQVPEGFPNSYPTEIWRFTSRTGDVVYGHNPLLWFAEWDPEAGDVAEATPYGGKLRPPQSKNINDPGAASGFPELIEVLDPPGPPKGAIPYIFDEDPSNNRWWLDC